MDIKTALSRIVGHLDLSTDETADVQARNGGTYVVMGGRSFRLAPNPLSIVNGRQYVAGMGIGTENSPSGMQTQVLFLADRFAVMSQVGATPKTFFAIQNGQTIINQAFIGDATITSAMIAAYIESTNYVAGATGWRLSKDGTFENNGYEPGNGRMVQTNNQISVYDGNGVLRVRIGKLT